MDDLKGLRESNFSSKGTWSTSLGFHKIKNKNVWVFQHNGHSQCNTVTFEQVSKAIIVDDEQPNQSEEVECDQDDHYFLLPYFYDNIYLKHYYFKHFLDIGQLKSL